MRAGITERPTRPLTEAEQVFFEAPHGPDWATRLTAALQKEYGYDPTWDGPYRGELGPYTIEDGGPWLWWVKR